MTLLAVRPANGQSTLDQLEARLDRLKAAQQFPEMERVAREYLRATQQTGQPLAIAAAWRALGISLDKQGQYPQAEAAYRSVLKALEGHAFSGGGRRLADDVLLDVRLKLAQLAENLARHAEAEAMYKDAIRSIEAASGKHSHAVTQPLIDLAGLYNKQSRYQEAEALYDRAEGILRSEKQLDVDRLTYVLHGRGVMNAYRGEFFQAEALYKEELLILRQLYGEQHVYCAEVQLSLAQTYLAQRRIREAVPLLEQAAALFAKAYGRESQGVASAQITLAGILLELGRFAEAESLCRQSLATREKLLGPNHPQVAESLHELASLCLLQDRHQEALPLCQRSLAIEELVFGREHPGVTPALFILTQALRSLGDFKAGEAAARRLVTIMEQSKNRDLPEAYLLLASIHRDQESYDSALRLCQQALELNRRTAEGNSNRITKKRAVIYAHMSILYSHMNRSADALDILNRSIELHEETGAGPGELADLLVRRGEMVESLKGPSAALADIRRAMELAEQQRITLSGGDTERAGAFSGYGRIYEAMVRLQKQLDNPQAALEAMERGQARSLIDQMNMQGVDFFNGMAAEDAARLQQRLRVCSDSLARAERQFQALDELGSRTPEQSDAERRRQLQDLRAAQAAFAEAHADIRNASPAYRRAVGQALTTVELKQLRQLAQQRQALLLRYFVGARSSFVLVVSPDFAQLKDLKIDADAARTFGVDAGDLNAEKLRRMLSNRQPAGVLELLRSSRNKTAVDAATLPLSALWRTLIPEPEREALLAQSYRELVVIPNEGLSLLPFEALVCEPGDAPNYLLDAGPPILYAPSATILYDLTNLGAARLRESPHPVLSVGDPAYGQSPTAAEASVSLAASSRFRAAGGRLNRLPYSALEAAWIAQVFQKQDIPVKKLLGPAATEANVRSLLPGSRIVHLACHGLADRSFGNLFGALALAPPLPSNSDPADDGFLTLSEVYQLNLKGCELAILSACDTNFGPQQKGEGIWALSRGFLVAGARRVVASNWFVDDKAAASLVSYFSSGIANAEGRGEPPNYVRSLHQAKRWVRAQEQWSSPYYWAPFVLVGAD